MKIACQGYTWQMAGRRWVGRVDEILKAVQEAGYEGFETEFFMLGPFRKDPQRLAEKLERYGLRLAALAYVGTWIDKESRDHDIDAALRVIEYLRSFPDALLVLAGGELEDRDDIAERFGMMCSAFNEIGKRGAASGVKVGCHPHSHGHSIFADEDDYRRLLEMTDADTFGFVPDAGHIARTGLDPVNVFNTYRSRIIHVHLKDYDYRSGRWAAMGQGGIDFPALLADLRSSRFAGWIVVEEESAGSEQEPAKAAQQNRGYLEGLGY